MKFTPKDGEISIFTSNDIDGHLRVEVSDTGVGIESEALPKIFDAFEQGDRSRGRVGWIAPVLGLLASLNHPWQGELLILIVVATEAVGWRPGQRIWPRLALPATTVVATALGLDQMAGQP